MKQGMENIRDSKQQNFRTWIQQHTIFFLSKQCENVPITGLNVPAHTFGFTKKLNITNFQASDGLLRNWKER